MNQLPVYIQSEKINILLVGGGKIALRKLKSLLAAGGKPTIIALQLIDEMREVVQKAELTYYERPYEQGEAASFQLVVVATNCTGVNEQIQADAQQLICRVDDAEKGNAILPATIRKGQLVLTISTGGASPGLTKKIIKQLDEQFDESYSAYIDFLSVVRKQHKGNRKLLQAVVDDRFLLMTEEGRRQEVEKLLEMSD